MLSYLYNSGMHATFDALKNESNNADIQMDEPGAATRYHGLLEKKWTSVIRLQKKVSSLVPFEYATWTRTNGYHRFLLELDYGPRSTKRSPPIGTRPPRPLLFNNSLQQPRLDPPRTAPPYPPRPSRSDLAYSISPSLERPRVCE